jgi:hypothetical protein
MSCSARRCVGQGERQKARAADRVRHDRLAELVGAGFLRLERGDALPHGLVAELARAAGFRDSQLCVDTLGQLRGLDEDPIRAAMPSTMRLRSSSRCRPTERRIAGWRLPDGLALGSSGEPRPDNVLTPSRPHRLTAELIRPAA